MSLPLSPSKFPGGVCKPFLAHQFGAVPATRKRSRSPQGEAMYDLYHAGHVSIKALLRRINKSWKGSQGWELNSGVIYYYLQISLFNSGPQKSTRLHDFQSQDNIKLTPVVDSERVLSSDDMRSTSWKKNHQRSARPHQSSIPFLVKWHAKRFTSLSSDRSGMHPAKHRCSALLCPLCHNPWECPWLKPAFVNWFQQRNAPKIIVNGLTNGWLLAKAPSQSAITISYELPFRKLWPAAGCGL